FHAGGAGLFAAGRLTADPVELGSGTLQRPLFAGDARTDLPQLSFELGRLAFQLSKLALQLVHLLFGGVDTVDHCWIWSRRRSASNGERNGLPRRLESVFTQPGDSGRLQVAGPSARPQQCGPVRD